MNKKEVRTVCFVALFVLGVTMTATGPALKDLADQTGSTLAALGAFISATFAGSLITQIVIGPSIDRMGPRPILIAGSVLSAVGLLGVLLSPVLWLTLALGVLLGVGYGAIEISTNVWIAEVFADHSVSVLNLLHVFFGMGAVTGPALAGVSLRLFDTALPVLWLGIGAVLAPAVLGLRMKGDQAAPRKSDQPSVVSNGFNYFAPLLWVLGLMLLMYVGVETGIGAWTTTYVDKSTALSKADGAWAASGFWLALTAGRVMGSLWGGRFSPYTVLRWALTGALVGGVLYILGVGHAPLTIGATMLIGFCFGPVYPTSMAVTTATFRNGPGKATSVVSALGSIGGSALPWIEGQLLNRVSMSANALFVAIGIAGILLLYGATRLYNASQTAASTVQAL